MSIIITGKGFLITISETELICPICEQSFDASEKMDKAKYPVFKTKCPICKGRIMISIPIFGGTTKCSELEISPNVERLETVAPFTVNGKEVKSDLDNNLNN